MPGSVRKAQIRGRIWDLLRRRAIVRAPGVYGRTPKFRGASQSAARLRATGVWAGAARVLALGEPVLHAVRAAVIEDEKVLVVPDLARSEEGWIVEIDGRVLGREQARKAARLVGTGKPLPAGVKFLRGRETKRVDLMVIGAVAVTRDGSRVGKGVGEADLVYALGRDRGFLGSRTPVAVIVHHLQLLDESTDQEPTDLPVDLIFTPDEHCPVNAIRMRPKGLHPSMITPRRLQTFPGLRQILTREGIAVPENDIYCG